MINLKESFCLFFPQMDIRNGETGLRLGVGTHLTGTHSDLRLGLKRLEARLRLLFYLFILWTVRKCLISWKSFPPSLSWANLCIRCTWPQMTGGCGNNTMTNTPVPAVPFVITFGYNNFPQGPNKRITKWKVCSFKIKDAGSTISDFIRHKKTVSYLISNMKVNVAWLANILNNDNKLHALISYAVFWAGQMACSR